jgi:hypothetical protein
MDRFQIIKGEEPEPDAAGIDGEVGLCGLHIIIVIAPESFEARLFLTNNIWDDQFGVAMKTAEIHFDVEKPFMTWPNFSCLLNTEITYYPIGTFKSRTNPHKLWVRGVDSTNIKNVNGVTIRKVKLTGKLV